MVIRPKDMRTEVRKDMKGGTGEVTVQHLVACDDQPNVRFIGEMTLPAGAAIGNHTHDTETEYYLISEGIGLVNEGAGDIKVCKGDVIVTGGGATHRIRNGGHTPLKIIAFIVTH